MDVVKEIFYLNDDDYLQQLQFELLLQAIDVLLHDNDVHLLNYDMHNEDYLCMIVNNENDLEYNEMDF